MRMRRSPSSHARKWTREEWDNVATPPVACLSASSTAAMTVPQPKYISLDDLAERLHADVSILTGVDLTWWINHRVSPRAACYGESSHFMVAAMGTNVIFFADDEDEFGVGRFEESRQTITDYGLAGDLRDAVRIVQTVAFWP